MTGPEFGVIAVAGTAWGFITHRWPWWVMVPTGGVFSVLAVAAWRLVT